MRLTASLECILGLFLSETVVDFDGGWDSREERGVEWLEDEIGVGQIGETGRTVVTMSAISKKFKGLVFEQVLTFGKGSFLDARR